MNHTFIKQHDQMIKTQIIARGIQNIRVINAMQNVPRHAFVLKEFHDQAYDDNPLSIGYGQTISQPYIVAYMSEALNLKPTDRVLEIGTGSGYQSAILSKLVDSVYTIEIIEQLGNHASTIFQQLGYQNITSKIGDGYYGWSEESPFDCIIITAAPSDVPNRLIEQLDSGGRLILPVGRHRQVLLLIEKDFLAIKTTRLLPVRFVPMTGAVQKMNID